VSVRSIDMHAHLLVPEVEALVAEHPAKAAEMARMATEMGPASMAHHQSLMPTYGPKLTDLSTRLADMDAMGVDMHAISLSPTQYYYWADPELAAQIVEAANRGIREFCAQRPERFVGLAAVSLQHPKLASEQLRKATAEYDLRGVEISTRIGDVDLADPSFEVFWQTAEELGSLVFIHPLGCSMGERLAPNYLSNIVGQPAETTVALSHLIFGGILDRYPALKICAAHGGGYFPMYITRADHGYDVRPEIQRLAERPSAYLKRLWYDSLVYTPEALRNLVDQVGADRIVIGTDYPFDMGMYEPHAQIDAVPDLTEAERDAIRGGNAASLLNIK